MPPSTLLVAFVVIPVIASLLGLDPMCDANTLRQWIGAQHQEAHLQKRIKVCKRLG